MRNIVNFLLLFLMCLNSGQAAYDPKLSKLKLDIPTNDYEWVFSCKASYQEADLFVLTAKIPEIIERLTPFLNLNQQKKKQVIVIYYSPKPDSFIDIEGKIYISDGLLNRIQSQDELAFVIAHELAHQYFRHNQQGNSITDHALNLHEETAADSLALSFLNVSGYQPHSSINLLSRLSEIYKNRYLQEISPKIRNRINFLKTQLESPDVHLNA